jgi:YVTN family beta-propeller protein
VSFEGAPQKTLIEPGKRVRNVESIIDVATNNVTTIPAGVGPFGLDITSDGALLYVANHDNNGTVSVINTTTNTIVRTIPAGNQPVAMGRFIGGPVNCSPVRSVDIDIKPRSFPNCFNIDGNGVIPVAILGKANFNVTDVDINTLSFAGLDVGVRGNNTRQCSVEDVSGNFTSPEGAPDGYRDLVCQFVDDPTRWTPDDGTATLTGKLLNGTPFKGIDSICLVP